MLWRRYANVVLSLSAESLKLAAPLAAQNPDIVQDFFNFVEKVGDLVLPILITLK